MKKEALKKHDKYKRLLSLRSSQKRLITMALAVVCLIVPAEAFLSVPTLVISQIPLPLVIPSRPQVLIAVANSESMDGDLSGAIYTGSGILSSGLTSLYNSSSPTSYLVPSGFTPPLQTANIFGYAPYTVSKNGTLYDNSASRLNVAKAAITAILQAYLQTTDFALETYNTSGASVNNTWVYYMSPPGANFTFTNIQTAGNTYVINPCFGYLLASSTVASNCASLATLFGGSATLNSNLFMQIGATSDNAAINDVLYTNASFPGVFVTYGGPTPVSPFPPYFSISNYNNGSVSLRYSSTNPNVGPLSLNPTNAGYVPFSPQVMFAQRGFGFLGSQSASTGTISVNMTNLGSNPSTASINSAIGQFTPFLNPETNNASTPEIDASAEQSPTAGLLSQASSYLASLVYSGSNCPPAKYVILISDGLPTEDLSGNLWPPLGSVSATGYGVTATFNADGSLNTTNDQALTDTINTLATLKAAGVKTYIIGLGAGVDPSLNLQAAATLTAMAVAGGTANYYPATSSTALVNDLNTILLSIQNGSYSTTGAAVSSTQIQIGAVEYQASFVSSDTPYQDWTGNLVENTLNSTTGLPVTPYVWAAQPLLDQLVLGTGWSASRYIATWNPTLNSNAGDGVPFEWNKISTAQQALLQPSDALGSNRLQYLRGNTALEVRNGGSFRNRSHILGDIVDSQAVYVGAPSGFYFSIPSYTTFVTTYATRTPIVYVGANDGMLHAFNATTGAEIFAYVPNSVIKNLYNLTATTYNQNHLFFVDGSPQTNDVQFSDASWHTLLVGGQGGGGNSIYALDITNPSTINNETQLANNVLWEFTDSDMGLSYSKPQIAAINPSSTTQQTFAVFVGNGYNNPNNNAVLYALNPQTGAILRKINFCTSITGICSATKVQGLSSVAVGTQDGIQGQAITQVYAGDLQGNLWAVDVSNSSPAAWTPRLLFQARDSSGNPQPITTKPLVTLQPIYPRLQGLFVMFTTGQFLTSADLTSTQLQTVYGVWDKPNASTVFTRSNLQRQILTLVLATVSGLPENILTDTNTAVSWAVNVGWFDDLVVGGQRAVEDPQLLNGAFIATLITPPGNICTAPFTSILLELNYQTGGSFSFPQLDINGTGVINSSDQYNGTYPVGMSIGSGYVTAPTILGANSSNNRVKLFTQGNGKQFSEINPNNASHIMSWWQVE